MQANEFERNIQNAMETFSLAPSDEVWGKVAERIAQKRKKRRFVFWFFTSIMLFCGTYFWMHQSHRAEKLTIEEKHFKTKEVLVNETLMQGSKTNLVSIKPSVVTKKEDKPTLLHKHTVGCVKIGQSTNVLHTQNENRDNISVSKIDKSKSIKVVVNSAANRLALNEVLATQSTFNSDSSFSQTSHTEHTPADSISNIKKAIAQLKPNLSIPAKANPTAKSNKGKWKMGFNIFGGLSNNLASANSGSNSSASYAISPAYSPSQDDGSSRLKFTNSLSVGLGVFIYKQVSEKLRLSAGLDYQFYQARSKVGFKSAMPYNFYDSSLVQNISVKSYYNQGSSTTFMNHYHLLEMPINLSYKINKNEQHQISVSAGVTPGLILSSSALLENKYKGIYYESKEQFHQFHLSLNTGLMYTLKNGKSYKIELGPVIKYQLTNLVRSDVTIQQHLLFTGIKTNFILK